MKKFVLLLCAVGALGPNTLRAKDDCNCNVSGHTTFVVMPQYQTATPERITGFRNRIGARKDGIAGALEVVPFGGQSTKHNDLAKFFTPYGKTKLTVSNNFTRDHPDLLSEHFNIYTQETNPAEGVFNSTICLKAAQTVMGVGLTYKQGLFELPCNCGLLWLEFAAPIIHVKNKVTLSEDVSGNNTALLNNGMPQNMTQAFRQEKWEYGKIDNCREMGKTALADLEIKAGYQWLKTDCCFFESFAGIVAPTGNKPTAHYLFEPVVGFGRHLAGEIGMTGIFQFWKSCDERYIFSFALDMNAWFFAEGIERRSFDLKGRPWSRYMQVYANKEQAEQAATLNSLTLGTPGINVFTKDLCVNPRMAKIVNSAFVVSSPCVEAEFGYNFFTRQAECVKLASCWKEGPALKAIDQGAGYTNNLQTINRWVTSDAVGDAQPLDVASYDLNLIKECDLDLESAAQPGYITSTFYGSFLWHWDDLKFPCLAGIGGSFEYCDDNTALSRWLAWAKVGFSF